MRTSEVARVADRIQEKIDAAGSTGVYRVGQILSTAGLGDFPPTVLVGTKDVNQPMRVGGPIWGYHVGDVVSWIPQPGAPLVTGILPIVGSEWDPADDEFEPWHEIGAAGEPAFVNSWVNFGGVYDTAAYWMQEDGWVRLKGLIKSGTATSGTTIFTLPSGMAPPFICYYVVSTNNVSGVLKIDTSGNVKCHGAINNTYVSLNGIAFPSTRLLSTDVDDRANLGAWEVPTFISNWAAGTTETDFELDLYVRSDGWVWAKGAITADVVPGNALTLPARSAAGYYRLILPALGFGASRHDLGGNNATNNPRLWRIQSGGGAVEHTIGGLNWWGVGCRGVDQKTPGVDVTFQNGWTNFGSGHHPVRYRKDAHGVVHLMGLAQGNASSSDTIFTLPAGFRPGAKQVFNGMWNDTQGRTDIYPDGGVEAAGHPNNTWHTLSGGVSFRAVQ